MISGQGNGYTVAFHQLGPIRLAKQCKVYGKLILMKITEIVATRCHILKLKCTNSISAGAVSQTTLESLQRFPAP